MRWYKNLSKSSTGTRIVYWLGGDVYFSVEIKVISRGGKREHHKHERCLPPRVSRHAPPCQMPVPKAKSRPPAFDHS